MEVDVGQERFHGATLGDSLGFAEVGLRALGAGTRAGEKPRLGAGEEAAGKKPPLAGAAEAIHGGVQFAVGDLERGVFAASAFVVIRGCDFIWSLGHPQRW